MGPFVLAALYCRQLMNGFSTVTSGWLQVQVLATAKATCTVCPKWGVYSMFTSRLVIKPHMTTDVKNHSSNRREQQMYGAVRSCTQLYPVVGCSEVFKMVEWILVTDFFHWLLLQIVELQRLWSLSQSRRSPDSNGVVWVHSIYSTYLYVNSHLFHISWLLLREKVGWGFK